MSFFHSFFAPSIYLWFPAFCEIWTIQDRLGKNTHPTVPFTILELQDQERRATDFEGPNL